jgi:O-antigen/teichoic acid export membrane protein
VPAAEQGEGADLLTDLSAHGQLLATAKGGGFLIAGTLFEFASRFVIALVLARALGADDYGLYVLAISAASLFAGISLLGLDDAMVRYVAIRSGRRDDAGVAGTLQLGLGVAVGAGLLMAGVLFLCAKPIADGLFHEPELEPLLRLLATVVPFLAVSNVLLGTARGFRRMDYAAFAEKVIPSVVRVALVCLLVVIGGLSLYAAAIVFGLADVAASITLVLLLKKQFPLERSLHRGVRRDVREIFRFALPLWLSGLLRQFRGNIQAVLLGAMSAVANVGIFAIVARVTMVSTVTSQSVYVASKPLMAQLHDRNDREGLAHLYKATTRWTFGLSAPFFLASVLYPDAILSVFGSAFAAGTMALILAALAQLVNGATGTCQGMLDMTGHTRAKLANTALMTVLLLGGGVLLIPRWNVAGAAAASLIAIATVNIVAVVEVWMMEGLLPFDRTFWKQSAAGLVAFTLGLALETWIPVGTNFALALVQGAIITAVYIALIVRFGLTPDDRMVLDRVLGKIRAPFRRRRAVARVAGGAGR